ncbi:MAG TPA: 16S rRNA (cytidine(1402)-2'-O)-methyltransferase [Thermodesulfobacteriota bacterium]|nr:16S rRNA (cytidine(1402)-2'-O)-methyltransferase [Deltaproteobacteria bacterium]HNU72533.1 16S rRNA (cytidine(1402)-2'-O)-methyltransferase [Thermodesulfobacteriota bacterium]HOC38458.1 16S rRNA (cytidine(1402)-2'-O)-methyltransferase [Thermodesulfobacteriota bacterium]
MPVAPGPLYIVATPIGNLEDITYRAVSILKRVDYIAAEDTRRTKKLLTAYGLSGRLVPYHDHNKQRQAGRIVADLIDGQSVALVSDAGTPGISDPGYLLINEAIRNNIAVIPIPGPSAIIAALSVSGLPTDRFAFEGYLPRKPSRRRACIEEFKQEMRTLIIYESPYRIAATLHDILDICGNRYVVIAREITKIHEEITRDWLSSVLQSWAPGKVKGEFTIILASEHHSIRLAREPHRASLV